MALESPISWFLEQPVVIQLTILGLGLVAIQQIRQGHIGRVGIATAGILVVQQAYPIWGALSTPWRIYALLAALFGTVAAISYLTKTSLTTEFYKAAFLLLGGGTIIMVLWVGFPL